MEQEISDSTLLDTWASGGNIVEPDISKIIEGWQLGEQPPHEYMNWLQNTFGSKLNHILKNGVASWNNTTQYLAGSSVQHNGNVWLCKATNTNSEPADVNANWKRIITVESLITVLNGYVKNSGDETIDGIKTFSLSPIVPTPTTDFQAATKKYVDDNITPEYNPTPTIATGTATFDATTNNINLTGIGIGVEIGDVIQISGSTNNNDTYTVEVIPNANNIIVNQAHANKSLTYSTGQRTKTLNGETSTVTVKLLAKWYEAPIDLGRDWVDVTSSRTVGTQYTNNTNRGIKVNLYGSQNANTYFRLSVNGFVMSTGGTGTPQVSSQISQIVPRNGKYTQSQDAGAAVSAYLELR